MFLLFAHLIWLRKQRMCIHNDTVDVYCTEYLFQTYNHILYKHIIILLCNHIPDILSDFG